MLPVFTAIYALSDLAASMILGASLLVSSAIQPLFGLLADRRPTPGLPLGRRGRRRRRASRCRASRAATSACWPASWAPGLGIAAFHPEAARVANQISAERKATGLAWFMVGGNAGFAAGPLLAALFIPLLDERATLVFLVPGRRGLAVALPRARAPGRRPSRAPRAHAPRRGARASAWSIGAAAVRHQHAHLDPVLPARAGAAAARGRPRLLRPGGRLRRRGLRRRPGRSGPVAGAALADRVGGRRMLLWTMPVVSPLIAGFLLTDGAAQHRRCSPRPGSSCWPRSRSP